MDYTGSWENKDPDEKRRVGIDWSGDLEAGDKINASTWTVVVGTVTIEDEDNNDTTVACRIAGGADGESARIKNHSVSLNGEHFECTMRMDIRTR